MKLEVELSEAMACAISRRCVSERKTYGDVIHDLLTLGLGKQAPSPQQRITISATLPDSVEQARVESKQREELQYELHVHRLYEAMDRMVENNSYTFEELLTPARMQHLTSQKRAAWRRQMLCRAAKTQQWRVLKHGPNPVIMKLTRQAVK